MSPLLNGNSQLGSQGHTASRLDFLLTYRTHFICSDLPQVTQVLEISNLPQPVPSAIHGYLSNWGLRAQAPSFLTDTASKILDFLNFQRIKTRALPAVRVSRGIVRFSSESVTSEPRKSLVKQTFSSLSNRRITSPGEFLALLGPLNFLSRWSISVDDTYVLDTVLVFR